MRGIIRRRKKDVILCACAFPLLWLLSRQMVISLKATLQVTFDFYLNRRLKKILGMDGAHLH